MGSVAAIEGFAVDDVLGRGGFAEVLAARDASGREVALKIAHRPADPRFAVEAEALAAVGAPTVPALFAVGAHEGRPMLVLERLRGKSLSHALPVAAPLPLLA